jgi:hypothetical protein
LDLIQIEINKLIGKSIAEAQPVLVATGGNEELPLELRKLYLEEVGKHPEIQKGLKAVAEKLLSEL